MYGQDKQEAFAGGSMIGRQGQLRAQAHQQAVHEGTRAQPNCATNAAAQAKPELQEYLDRLGHVIERAESMVAQVAERTNGVLRPPAPAAEGAQINGSGPVTFYGQQVQHSISRIVGLNERLQDMLDRLEV